MYLLLLSDRFQDRWKKIFFPLQHVNYISSYVMLVTLTLHTELVRTGLQSAASKDITAKHVDCRPI